MSSSKDEEYIRHTRNEVEDDIGETIKTKLKFLDSEQFTRELLDKSGEHIIKGKLKYGIHHGAKGIGINYKGNVLPFNRLNRYRVVSSGSSSSSPETSLGGRRRTSKRKTYKKHNRSKRIHKFRT